MIETTGYYMNKWDKKSDIDSSET